METGNPRADRIFQENRRGKTNEHSWINKTKKKKQPIETPFKKSDLVSSHSVTTDVQKKTR